MDEEGQWDLAPEAAVGVNGVDNIPDDLFLTADGQDPLTVVAVEKVEVEIDVPELIRVEKAKISAIETQRSFITKAMKIS